MHGATIFLVFAISLNIAKGNDDLKTRYLYMHPRKFHQGAPVPKMSGQEADPDQFPYQAFLEIKTKDDQKWTCTGSLVSSNFVLTAAHCVSNTDKLEITLGAHNIKEKERRQMKTTPKKIVVHENFYQNATGIHNDIALVELQNPATLTEHIQTVKLASRNLKGSLEGESAIVSGWAMRNGAQDKLSPILRYSKKTIISNEQCMVSINFVESDQSCFVGDKDVSSCSAESGGPVMVNDVQVGLVSFGMTLCIGGVPSVFTNILSFADWIQEHSDVVIQ